jgi:DNA-binding Lrp family transcriptional regulator
MKPYKTDKTAEDILDIISGDSTVSSGDIARQLKITEDSVKKCVRKLEKDRIILRYKAQVNWERIREHEVRALIEVKVTPERVLTRLPSTSTGSLRFHRYISFPEAMTFLFRWRGQA